MTIKVAITAKKNMCFIPEISLLFISALISKESIILFQPDWCIIILYRRHTQLVGIVAVA